MQSKGALFLLAWTAFKAVSVPYILLSGKEESVKRCLSILIVAALWWIFEPIPSYVTSLAVIPMTVASGILTADGAAASFFDPTMFLFITGFSLAACMEKHRVTQKISAPFSAWAVESISLRGGDIRFFFGFSILSILLCSVLSNVAASVLMTTLGQSVARELGLDISGQKRLLLTIAFACNIGGMLVPIASPQNVIAVTVLRAVSGETISFKEWLIFASPIVLISTIFMYFFLRLKFGKIHPGYSPVSVELGESKFLSHKDQPWWTYKQVSVFMILTLTVGGWCFFDRLEFFFRHMGIYGLVSVVAMHASGLLTMEDFQALPWPILTMLGGGLCLGSAVEKSGLLAFFAHEISIFFNSFSNWLVLATLISGIAVMANFLSSTVCGLIVFPIVAKLGLSLSNPKLFVISAAIMTSGAMTLPVSSFPNANSAAVMGDDKKSSPIVVSSDFIQTGFPITVSILLLLCTFGYFWGGSWVFI